MKKAIFEVVVAGTNISAALAPVLLSMQVRDQVGTHADTAAIEVDDTDGRIVLPKPGAAVAILLGWTGEGMREVFRGTVDEVRSNADRGGGRKLNIGAKGVDTTGKAKAGQQRHFDQKAVKDILKEAGEFAGVTEIDVDPSLASVVIPYLDMRDESFIHMGERLAREIGGNFRINGTKAVLAKRAGGYTPSVTAAWGVNLHSWQMTPAIGRARYAKARARSYDREKARVEEDEAEVPNAGAGLDGFSDPEFVRREMMADRDSAKRAADGDAATSKEQGGGGTIVIEGTTAAVPDGLCILTGARPGIDGTYRIKTVTHGYDRGGGWVTSLEVTEPGGDAGSDTRGATTPAASSAAPSTGPGSGETVTGPQ